MDNSIAHNLKKYNKYLELQKKHGGYNNIYQYKINQYRQLLQRGGVKPDVLDNTVPAPIQRISEVVNKIDNIMSSISNKPMVGGTLPEIMSQIDALGTKLSSIQRPQELPANFDLDGKKQAIIAKITELRTQCTKGTITDEDAQRKLLSYEAEIESLKINIAQLNSEIEVTTKSHEAKMGDLAKIISGLEKSVSESNDIIAATTRAIEEIYQAAQ